MKRSFFQYVSLNVLGALGLSGYILADTLFVAHRLGTDGLAALNLAISVFGLINGLGLMLGIGGATRYAICRTQGDGVRADRAFSRALACGGTLGGLLALAGLLWAVPLARLLGAEGAILPMCSVYLRTVLFFAPCFLLNHILTAFVRNDGNPKLAMAAMLLGSLSNIVLDYVFLYPMDMGIFGAAPASPRWWACACPPCTSSPAAATSACAPSAPPSGRWRIWPGWAAPPFSTSAPPAWCWWSSTC